MSDRERVRDTKERHGERDDRERETEKQVNDKLLGGLTAGEVHRYTGVRESGRSRSKCGDFGEQQVCSVYFPPPPVGLL